MTASLPPVSIGIPFFNAEEDLLDAVRSVFAQTHEEWELILVDDGSTDSSLELAKSINDPRVRVYSDGENKRLASRLNQIAQLSNYEFVARMDADDLMSPTRIERQLQQLVSNPALDLVSTGLYSLDNDNMPIGVRCVSPKYVLTEKSLLAGNSGILNGSIVARRDWLLRNPYNETLGRAQDANLWIQAYSRNDLSILIMSEPLYYYREDNNVSEDRILSAYKVVRHSILNDAKQRYTNWGRIRAYAESLVKSVTIWILARLGRLDVIRRRRIGRTISESEQQKVIQAIKKAQATSIPLEPADH